MATVIVIEDDTDLPEFLKAVDELLRRIEFGLPSEALSLTTVPLTLTRGQYLALFAAGCTTADDVKNLRMDTLIECVGSDIASRLRPETS